MALRQAAVSLLLSSALALPAPAPAAAQGRRPVKRATDAAPVGGADSLNNLKFRNLGPSVAGGRVAAVVGVPGDRNVYYVGAAAGGVWKTTDGGDSWEAVFKDQPTSSIGALALAPSNPNVVWVGTGESNPRNDVVDGRGVFMSPDAGKSWQFMGLSDVGQVSQIVIDPANPD
ncbi:MAG TPA: glycosyl hydrolase, partial [Gemmatimonadales bacterium]|nr:glycosyl hydrolase [Gemmatimonadales bacterium]